jgi:hypothetical protein
MSMAVAVIPVSAAAISVARARDLPCGSVIETSGAVTRTLARVQGVTAAAAIIAEGVTMTRDAGGFVAGAGTRTPGAGITVTPAPGNKPPALLQPRDPTIRTRARVLEPPPARTNIGEAVTPLPAPLIGSTARVIRMPPARMETPDGVLHVAVAVRIFAGAVLKVPDGRRPTTACVTVIAAAILEPTPRGEWIAAGVMKIADGVLDIAGRVRDTAAGVHVIARAVRDITRRVRVIAAALTKESRQTAPSTAARTFCRQRNRASKLATYFAFKNSFRGPRGQIAMVKTADLEPESAQRKESIRGTRKQDASSAACGLGELCGKTEGVEAPLAREVLRMAKP